MLPVRKIRTSSKYVLSILVFCLAIHTIRLNLSRVANEISETVEGNPLKKEVLDVNPQQVESARNGPFKMEVLQDGKIWQVDNIVPKQADRRQLTDEKLEKSDNLAIKESEEFVINSRLRGVNLTEYHLALVEPEKLHTTRRMIYNRVPKCGSVTMWNLMSRVSRKNHFHTVASSIYDPPWVDEEEQKRTVVHVNGLREPFIYNRHLCFLDFPKFGYQMPVYVNLIRHPVDRFVSSYYYQRDLGKKKLTEEEYNVDINGCLERNFTECTLKGTFMLIPFFCGHGKECLQKTRGALGKAKENAVLYYGAVGLTEDFESFLKVLGCVIPHYFEGIDKIYKGKNANKTKDKGAFLTEANAKRLAQHMELEIEFYQFIKDRFYFLKQRLKGKCNV